MQGVLTYTTKTRCLADTVQDNDLLDNVARTLYLINGVKGAHIHIGRLVRQGFPY